MRSSLNHPNIAHIYGLEESANRRCIVMEFVDGETIQRRLQRGPIPVKEALAIARQIAEALEAAHESGIIHRDLKPGNVMLTPGGKAKVLDFGLAKTGEEQNPAADFSSSPTLMSAASRSGVILGTAAYMSPEQARGKGRQAVRYLGVRLRALRNADRNPRVYRRNRFRHHRSHPRARSRLGQTAGKYLG